MEEACSEMHSEDDKGSVEKNKKRTVKTPAQVQALEKFYNEHKYPTESMKIQLAQSIGLTEKQVSGWFCHRRLKDKRLINGDNNIVGRQDRSSGVIQDRGSGHRQDSCGSTKQGGDRNFETKEVESGRLAPQECSAAELTYERGGHYSGNYTRMDDASSRSSSSLRNMSNHNHKGDPVDAATSSYLIPKYPMDIKPRSGPSGYLKVKGRVENAAITAVKRQLGKDYREDGPPLGVEFDPLPPGAFESSVQDLVDETCYNEAVQPIPLDTSKFHQHPKFGKGYEYDSNNFSNSNIIRTRHKAPQGSDFPDNYSHQKFKQCTSLSNTGAYYPGRNSFVELPEISARDISGSEDRDDYGPRYRQPFGGKLRGDKESSLHKYSDVHRKSSRGETIENGSNLTMKGFEYHNSFNKVQPTRITKDGKTYAERRMINENQAPKRMRDEFLQQPHLKKLSVLENQPGTYRVIRHAAEMLSSCIEDEGSAETSSSVE